MIRFKVLLKKEYGTKNKYYSVAIYTPKRNFLLVDKFKTRAAATAAGQKVMEEVKASLRETKTLEPEETK